MTKLTRTLTFATTAIGSVVIAAANLGNAFLRASLPTPLEYAESHGQVYSELTKSGLKEFDHIKVMEHGSAELNIFCKINLLGALRSSLCSKGGFKPDFAYDPSIADWILGARPSIISQPYTEDTLKNEVARLAWRPLANTQLTPSIYLTYRILHETGHFSKKFAHDPSLQYQSELYADRSTIPALKREFGEIGAEFPLHYRALHQHMIDPHNNYLKS